jgi:hypothetical protein
MDQRQGKEKMKNPPKKNRVSSGESFDTVLASAVKNPVFSFESQEVRQWIDQFIVKARSRLEELYSKYGIPPDHLFVLGAICAQAPTPQEFPRRLRNGRERERTARLLERAADTIYELGALGMYGVRLFSDPALDLKLKAAAKRVRQVKSIPGRPKTPIMRDYAIFLADIFRLYANSPLYECINDLLHAAYPRNIWALHDNPEDAIRKLVGGKTMKNWSTSGDNNLKSLHDIEARKVVGEYEEKLAASNMSTEGYQQYLQALLGLARKYKINSV